MSKAGDVNLHLEHLSKQTWAIVNSASLAPKTAKP